MTAQVIDGKALAEELRQSFKARVDALAEKGQRPGLAVILVGEDAASQVYVRNKVNACQAIGMHSEKIIYDAAVDPEIVLKKIAELNADPNIHGILVQLPLPRQFSEAAVLAAIAGSGWLTTGRLTEAGVNAWTDARSGSKRCGMVACCGAGQPSTTGLALAAALARPPAQG